VPGAAPLQIGLSGPGDAFVARFYPVDGGHLNLTPAYSAYLGGSAYDWGYDIAVDTNGRAYVTGLTYSSDFPTVPFQTATTPTDDVFVSKVFPEYEQQCHWPHTIGATDTRNYDWGPQLATPGTAWRNAFQTAIQSWNSAGTNFVLFENAALSNITMDLANVPNGDSGLTFISCSGSTIIHSYVTVNTAINLTPVTEVPAHEIGHGQGLGHIASDGAIMRYDTGGVHGPQAQDVELHRLLYP